MAKGQMLRSLVKQRLTAAAEEIFELFDKTITEYEEELCRSKEENERQQKLLDAVLKPQVLLHPIECAADIQQLSETQEDVPLEPQEWSPILVQEDPEPPCIKEEQEELWTSQERERLQWQMQLLPVSECPADVQQLAVGKEVGPHEQQEWSPSLDQEASADEEDYGGSEAAINLVPIKYMNSTAVQNSSPFSRRTFDSNRSLERHVDTQTAEELLGPSVYGTGFSQEPNMMHRESKVTTTHRNVMNNNDFPVNDIGCNTKLHHCSECGKTFEWKSHLMIHKRVHTGEKPFDCSVCGKRFAHKSNLITHMTHHASCVTDSEVNNTDRNLILSDAGHKIKQFHCSYCDKSFYWKSHLEIHMRVHTGEKPFGCSVCSKRFAHKSNLITHMTRHIGDKSFNCSVGQKHFRRKGRTLTVS